MVEAYDLLVKSLKDQLVEERNEDRKKSDIEMSKRVEIEELIFEFVLRHCGRAKLIELGEQIDEMLENVYGRSQGYEEHVETVELLQE
jgi:hypothetical protein